MRRSTSIVALVIGCLSFALAPQIAVADCVFGAKSKTRFSRLDANTIVLTGGPGWDILVKTSCYIRPVSSVTVLKDSFCSFEKAVLAVDRVVCSAQTVELLR